MRSIRSVSRNRGFSAVAVVLLVALFVPIAVPCCDMPAAMRQAMAGHGCCGDSCVRLTTGDRSPQAPDATIVAAPAAPELVALAPVAIAAPAAPETGSGLVATFHPFDTSPPLRTLNSQLLI